MKSTSLVWALVVMAAVPTYAIEQTTATGFLSRRVVLDGGEYPYQVYVPENFRRSAALPVILFLHGSGGRGTDGLAQTRANLAAAIRKDATQYPAIAVFPQLPDGVTWQDLGARVALKALDNSVAELGGDQSRIYLVGHSMGANGPWYLAYHHSDRFAAVVAICGFVTERRGGSGADYRAIVPGAVSDALKTLARRVSRIAAWIVDAERAELVHESRDLAAAMRNVGAAVQYTELRGVGHDGCNAAYDGVDLPSWLFKQRRP